MRFAAAVAIILCVACASGCRDARAPGLSAPPPGAATILFFGDSITAGYGLDPEQAFPALVERALLRQGRPVRCVNAGLSGDTTTAALERLRAHLAPPPALVVVELGSNDMFRGFDRNTTFDNLVTIVELFEEAGARVILGGVRFALAHPAYDRSMARLYAKVAEHTGATFIPDLLAGVSDRADMNLPDRIHPNARGQQAIAATVLPVLETEIGRLGNLAPARGDG